MQIYAGLKPLLIAVSTLPIIPGAWRAALKIFIAALDSLAGGIAPDFKAGKDL